MSWRHNALADRPTVYLRTLADQLERALRANPDSAAEWVDVLNELSIDPPLRTWHHDDASLHVSLTRGHSEGYLLYVYAQEAVRDPQTLTPLLRVKLLCGAERAVQELGAVWSYLNSPEFLAATSAVSG